MNPVTLPMNHLLVDGNRGPRGRRRSLFRWLLARGGEDPLVFVRENLDELRTHRRPVVEDPFSFGTSRGFEMLPDPALQKLDIAGLHHRLEIHCGHVASLLGEV